KFKFETRSRYCRATQEGRILNSVGCNMGYRQRYEKREVKMQDSIPDLKKGNARTQSGHHEGNDRTDFRLPNRTK
ncbi:hypothetical protein L9F63_014766, partial [Diploptera punctata]